MVIFSTEIGDLHSWHVTDRLCVCLTANLSNQTHHHETFPNQQM